MIYLERRAALNQALPRLPSPRRPVTIKAAPISSARSYYRVGGLANFDMYLCILLPALRRNGPRFGRDVFACRLDLLF